MAKQSPECFPDMLGVGYGSISQVSGRDVG